MTNVTAGLKATSQGKSSGTIEITADKDISYHNSPSLATAVLGLVRNVLITVVIGSAMLLQGPDGGIHDLVGTSWSLQLALMFGLGLILNYRKLRTLCEISAKALKSAWGGTI